MPAASAPSREVFGFVQASVLDDPSVGYPSWDFSMLSTVAYFGEHVNWDGHIVQGDAGWNIWNSTRVNGLINTAHTQGAKVVLTLILMDGSANQNQMCSGLGWGDITISEGIAQMQSKGADGINIDYEGDNTTCTANNQTTQSMLITYVKKFRAAMPAGSYLSIDTYSGSGQGPDGFFNLPALAPYVDSFFVMAYDMEYYNWSGPPANCSRMCLGPTAPLTTYALNDTRTAKEYSATVPASKVILGVPYYGRKACVAIGTANDYPTSAIQADGYLDAAGEQPYVDTVAGTYSIHHDPYDIAGQERFDDWLSAKYNCTRQLYWDDFASLGAKYDLVNRTNLRGVGIWTLNYGGGAPELWCDLRDHFSAGHVPATVTLSTTQSSTQFTVNFAAGQGCGVSAFDLQEQDLGPGQPWLDIAVNMAPTSYVNQTYSGLVTTDGYRGHSYQFRVRTRDGQGNVGAWSPFAQTMISTAATVSRPFQGMYTLDAFGGVGADGSAPVGVTAYWPNWKIAKTGHALPGPNAPQGGLVLDGLGSLHPYGQGIANVSVTASWNTDIARDFAFLPDGSGGYVLDGYGGLHPFSVNDGGEPAWHDPMRTDGMPKDIKGSPYWPGKDIARKIIIFPNGSGGYVLDGYGGVHAFGIGRPAPPDPVTTGYWPNWDIAHDIALIPGTQSGYVMDGFGGLHQFAPAGQTMPPSISAAYWNNWDIARAIWFLPSATVAAPKGYLLDGYGGLKPIGSAPSVSPAPYWGGQDIAKNVWGA